MKLTIHNYFDEVGDYLDLINADKDLLSAHNFVIEATENGADWSAYNESANIKETIDIYLAKLAKLKAGGKKPTAKKTSKPAAPKEKVPVVPKKAPPTKRAPPKTPPKETPAFDPEMVEHIPSDIALVKRYISLHDKDKSYDQVLSIWRAFNKAIVERKVTKDSPHKSEIATMNSSLKSALDQARAIGKLHLVIPAAKLKTYKTIAESVERSAGVAILLEFINISGKVGMKERADKLIKRIRGAMDAGKLADDRYLKEIKNANAATESYVNSETDVVVLPAYALSGISDIAVLGCNCEKELSGFNRSQNAVILKLIQEKVKNLHDAELTRAFNDTVAPSICKMIALKLIEAKQLTMNLIRNPAKVTGAAISLSGSSSHKKKEYDFGTEVMDMRLRNAAKSGIGISGKMPKNVGLSGIDDVPASVDKEPEDVKIISAQELVDKKFRTIGLRGKFRTLIGDPEPGFSGMIHGKPKQGKSTVAIEFAKDLTHLGKVLYVAIEEGAGFTLQDKVIRNNANVPGLDFASKLPQFLDAYKYVFIDSVSDARMNEGEFGGLIKIYKPKEISIIGVFHATKDGKFRGGQTFAHDVDVLIRVEDGKAYAQGRYAPSNEINIAALLPKELRQAA